MINDDLATLASSSACVASCVPDSQKLALLVYLAYLQTSGGSIASATSDITTLVVTNALTGTPVVLGAAATTFRRVDFIGRNAARTANTGNVWIQFEAADSSAGFVIGPEEVRTYEAPSGRVFNLSQFYLDVETANDGILAILFS